jgi:hypothetical protein
MPKCPDCGYVYSLFVKKQCPRCHLSKMAGVPVVKAMDREGRHRGWAATTAGSGNQTLKTAVQDRWQHVVNNPDDLSQGEFGICGMAAALHVLLPSRKLVVADQLAAATFWDLWHDHVNMDGQNGLEKFHTAHCGDIHIDLSYLLRRHAQKWDEKAAVFKKQYDEAILAGRVHRANEILQEQAGMKECFTDFCVTRALGYLLKVTNPKRYHTEKCDFNKFFGEGDYTADVRKRSTRAGTFALRTDTVAFILRDLLGANLEEIAYNDHLRQGGYWLPGFAQANRKKLNGAPALMNEIGTQLGRHNFVIASINAHFIQDAAPKDPPAGVPYNHWVVIEGCQRSGLDHNDLTIWSWGSTFHPTDNSDHELLESVYSLIVGNFP